MDVELTQDRYVICQDAAKEMLAVAICDHYNRAKERSGQVAIHIIYMYIYIYIYVKTSAVKHDRNLAFMSETEVGVKR